ncbi:hypothetical protein E1091_14740 [Micromonospora fluostatini]|uniref:Integrase n=1 Tax=Micromonospora fluostatini TaxID=1629071 RepID=A0ABY2DEE6_9ACTN|nr:hypothetical protein E1091_14740 [Micromonospora fluostatini]
MGHASMRAALIYEHATNERGREIASAMDQRIARHAGRKGEQNSQWPTDGPQDRSGGEADRPGIGGKRL